MFAVFFPNRRRFGTTYKRSGIGIRLAKVMASDNQVASGSHISEALSGRLLAIGVFSKLCLTLYGFVESLFSCVLKFANYVIVFCGLIWLDFLRLDGIHLL